MCHARPAGQPGLDLRMPVRGVVVHDAMNVQSRRHGGVNFSQVGRELLMSVARLAGGKNSTV